MKAISIGNKFVSVGIFVSLVISLSSSEYWSENRAIFGEGPSTVFSLFFGVTPVGNRWPRTGIESLGLAVEGVRGALEILSPRRVPYHPPMLPV